MTNAKKSPPAYEVEFIPLERRLLTRRKLDDDPRTFRLGLAIPSERRRQQRRGPP